MTRDDHDTTCHSCQGTGIGYGPPDGPPCPVCHGSGERRGDTSDDDYEPDYDSYSDVDWDTPQDCGTDSRGRAW